MATQRFTVEQMRAWSDLLINARKSRGLTQLEVAEQAGLTVTTLSSLERGAYPNMSLVDSVKLGKFYGISPNQIATVLGLWSEEEHDRVATTPEGAYILEMFEKIPESRKEIAHALIKTLIEK